MKTTFAWIAISLLVACGGDDGDGGDNNDTPDAMAQDMADAAPQDQPDAMPAGPLTLTSTAFDNGTRFPDQYTCGGANISPPLAWTAGPTGTMSYAVVFTDTNNGLIHSVIWDIPSTVTALPENVEKVAEPSDPAGSKQARAYDNVTRGYLGPCPGSEHLYEFVVYALDAATLPGVTLSSTRTELEPVIQSHSLESATLQGTWGP